MFQHRFLILPALALVIAATVFAADVTGDWKASFEAAAGPQEYSFSFQASGSTLTGKVNSGWGEGNIRQGKIEGDRISFLEILDFSGETTPVTYKGTVSGDEIKFHRQVGDIGSEEFVAKRVK